uniref:Putative secreted protein n=1 Tax=Anopheles triannulatus TaxID=58253 RepID=A0A2M4B6Q1_9DIPT
MATQLLAVSLFQTRSAWCCDWFLLVQHYSIQKHSAHRAQADRQAAVAVMRLHAPYLAASRSSGPDACFQYTINEPA